MANRNWQQWWCRHSQNTHQQVIAPLDGVVTKRNVDVGSLITADATSGTSMFSLVRSNVIRVGFTCRSRAALE
jgi:multidrug efflux pump subunit AcrA (membrane-fusion protein)